MDKCFYFNIWNENCKFCYFLSFSFNSNLKLPQNRAAKLCDSLFTQIFNTKTYDKTMHDHDIMALLQQFAAGFKARVLQV